MIYKPVELKGRELIDAAEGRALGDTTTLADPSVVARLKGEYEAREG